MVEVRIHGRGGRDVVTASDLLAMAAFTDGHHARAFPSFDSKRTGAPVVAFCRIAETKIRTCESVLESDVVIVRDPTLLSVMDVFAGLKPESYALLNSTKGFEELGLSELVDRPPKGYAITLPALDLTREHVGRPVPNVVMLGGIATLTGFIRLQSVADAVRHRFPGRAGDVNVSAVAAAYDLVAAERGRADPKGNADA